MRYIIRPSYIRSIKNIRDIRRLKTIHQAVATLKESLEIKIQPPYRLGMKRLRENFWEIRSGLADRIIFYREKDTIEFILAGNHNDIKRFLNKF